MQELITQEVYRLRYAWEMFKLLFATEEENIKILNATGSEFFGTAERLMWDDVILHICRLTDRAALNSQKNVTLAQLLDATGWATTDNARWTTYTAKLTSVLDACAACRKHRNKRISHLDLRWATKALALPNAGLKNVNGAIEAIEEFAAAIYSEIHPDASISFEILNSDWGVKNLLRRLKNRAAQRRPNAVVAIRYRAGSADAELECPFCDAKEAVSFYPQRSPISTQMIRWHFDKCDGVVGHETLAVQAVDIAGYEAPLNFTIDLMVPTNKTT